MKTLTVRLPENLIKEITSESRSRSMSRSDIVRERLVLRAAEAGGAARGFAEIEDLVGSVEGLPADLSARKKAHLSAKGYGSQRRR